MIINYYLYSIISGLVIFVIMLINTKYIEKDKIKYINFIIPIITTIIILSLCFMIENKITILYPSYNALNQEILTEPF
jgi:hypothetical protein